MQRSRTQIFSDKRNKSCLFEQFKLPALNKRLHFDIHTGATALLHLPRFTYTIIRLSNIFFIIMGFIFHIEIQ